MPVEVFQIFDCYNKFIFVKTVLKIIVRKLSYVGTGTNLRQERGSGHCNSLYYTKLVIFAAFEWGRIPCSGKLVSTRAHKRVKYNPIDIKVRAHYPLLLSM